MPIKIPERKRTVVDYTFCFTREDLKRTIDFINRSGYDIVTITEGDDGYTVFFRRSVYG